MTDKNGWSYGDAEYSPDITKLAREVAETADLADWTDPDGFHRPEIADFDQLAAFIADGIDQYRAHLVAVIEGDE